MSGKVNLNLSEQDKTLIRLLQQELPLVSCPYEELGRQVGLDEQEVLQRVSCWVESGIIRRFGATVRHQRVGYSANCMVVWKAADDQQADLVGEVFSGFTEVTHCYRRPRFEDWPYTLYTMVHSTSEQGIERTLERMKQASGLTECRGLFSEKEWKKTSMKYFSEQEGQ
jgi:siroheme decarboxylase